MKVILFSYFYNASLTIFSDIDEKNTNNIHLHPSPVPGKPGPCQGQTSSLNQKVDLLESLGKQYF